MSNEEYTKKEAFWFAIGWTTVVALMSCVLVSFFNVPREIYSSKSTTYEELVWLIFVGTSLLPLGVLDHVERRVHTPYILGWFIVTILRVGITFWCL
jgi:hypothetical protein